MNKVLFPSADDFDFASAGAGVGWVPVSSAHNLMTMAEKIIVPEENQRADHAIPSPVAHIMEYKRKLREGDERTVNEWRGMLAVLALQKILALKITTKEIPLKNGAEAGNPSMFGSVIGDALVEHSAITGYNEDNNTLTVFCKDEKPFAMFMPGMVICPFKEYPKNLFAGIGWYDETSGHWTSIKEHLLANGVLAKNGEKLWLWLNDIIKANYFAPLDEYKRYLSQENIIEEHDTRPVDFQYQTEKFWNELKKVCPMPTNAPENAFSDKLFIVIPPEQFPGSNGARNKLEPRLCHTIERSKNYYVIPPVHTEIVDGIKKGHFQLISWDIEHDGVHINNFVGNKYTVMIKILFPNTNETQTYIEKYDSSKIVWTNAMPYISVWPYADFVNDSWREHYVSIWPDENASGRRLDHAEITTPERSERLLGEAIEGNPNPAIEISVTNKKGSNVQIYNCKSKFKNKSFTMHKSDSQTFALNFAYTKAGKSCSLGSWVIDRSAAKRVESNGAHEHVVISMDFGTTSTNVYINPLGATINNCTSISSPGKYLQEIYNPYARVSDGRILKEDSDFYQNYYLFSARKDALGKIFTYGQNFDAAEKGGTITNDCISNVSGRAVVVDESFICNSITNDEAVQDICRESRIYNNLKLLEINNDTERRLAANNFIKNILTQAVLEACVDKDASNITIRVSYPAKKYGATVLNNLVNIADELHNKCGKNITLEGATEALAAGTYFAEHYRGTLNAPDPRKGYLIVDIGGGTTDVSYWRQEEGDATVQLKQEHSFGYAGKFLVTKTIIQALANNDNAFEQMWCPIENRIQEFAETKEVIESYTEAQLARNINYDIDPGYQKKIVSLDFILENSELNTGVLFGDSYTTLISSMRMKYYALFYLIATYIHKKIDSGNIRLSEGDFKICFAGCGSKGMNICKQGRPLSETDAGFYANVERLFKVILKLPDHCAFGITPSPNRDKKEVVVGLGILSKAEPIHRVNLNEGNGVSFDWRKRNNDADDVPVNHAEANISAEESCEEVVKDETYEEKLNRLKAAYGDLLDMLKAFEGETELLTSISLENPEAYAYFIGILTQVLNQLEASNCDIETENENFAMLMLDSMLSRFI